MKKAGMVTAAISFLMLSQAIITGSVYSASNISKGFLSREDVKLNLGGEVLIEFVDNGADCENNKAQFRIEFISINPKLEIEDDISFESEIKFETSGEILLNELYAKFENLPLNSWLKVGLEDRFIKVKRKTETYPIQATAWWRDDDQGIQWGGEVGSFYWRTSLTNGNQLGQKALLRGGNFPIIQDDRLNGSKMDTKEIGLGLGKVLTSKLGKLDLLGFCYRDKLSKDDISFLQTLPGYGVSTDKSTFYGVNFDYTRGNSNLFAQLIKAEDGDLKRSGWYAQPSYKFEMPGRTTFNKYTILLRYNDYQVDIEPDVSDSRTWDRKTLTLAARIGIKGPVELLVEYDFNDENTGGKEVEDDGLLCQLYIEY
ncbi:MAG: hypothetical protein QME81_10735 [bacterium]|nr:hypothetical protein [bacterium]